MVECKTKYPIMLVHGIGYSDKDNPRYWGRIPMTLKDHGAEIHFSGQDSFGNIRSNAGQLYENIKEIIEKSGAEKINMIAHSRGGIDARFVISETDASDMVASLTTIATPHKGISSIDIMKGKNSEALEMLYRVFGTMLSVDGGERPEDNKVYDQLSADYMDIFNEFIKDDPDVYYQSYAFDMKNRASDPAMGLFHSIVLKNEGENDGFVSVDSAKWGDFRGIVSGMGMKGISHPKAVDGRRNRFTPQGHRHSSYSDGGVTHFCYSDITDFYIDMVARLAEMGY